MNDLSRGVRLVLGLAALGLVVTIGGRLYDSVTRSALGGR